MKANEYFSLRVMKEVHPELVAVAKYHRRSLTAAATSLITEEYRRLVKAGSIKEPRGNE